MRRGIKRKNLFIENIRSSKIYNSRVAIISESEGVIDLICKCISMMIGEKREVDGPKQSHDSSRAR